MGKKRILNFASASNQSLLHDNQKHIFAHNHALKIYSKNAIYSFIPKNACSTMRLSIAIENGCVKGPEGIDWIHKNNQTFRADLQGLLLASYAFVILRCPFARLASCFLDKIVGKGAVARRFCELPGMGVDIDGLSFELFVETVCKPGNLSHNQHWQPQLDFLVYEDYDDYFCVEDFGAAVVKLKQAIGLDVVDARGLTAHGISGLELLGELGDFSGMTVGEINRLKQEGKSPHPRSLYNDKLIALVAEYYREDFLLYLGKIGDKFLFPVPGSFAGLD